MADLTLIRRRALCLALDRAAQAEGDRGYFVELARSCIRAHERWGRFRPTRADKGLQNELRRQAN